MKVSSKVGYAEPLFGSELNLVQQAFSSFRNPKDVTSEIPLFAENSLEYTLDLTPHVSFSAGVDEWSPNLA